MPRHQISRSYNIAESILRAAEALGLDALATGGNTDFIFKKIGTNVDGSDRIVVLTSAEGGGSPDALSEKAELIVALDDEWHDQIGIPCPSTRAALTLMAGMHDPYAAR